MVIFLVGLCILIAGLILRRHPLLARLSLGFAFVLLVTGGIICQFALSKLQDTAHVLRPEWKSRNAIVILGFGTVKWTQTGEVVSPSFAYPRIQEGARLYYSCKQNLSTECKILVSGGDPLGNGISEAEVMAGELNAIGIPKGDIILEAKSRNTFQNARFSAPLLKNFDHVYLVTSGFHMKRAQTYFDHFFPGAEPAPADQMAMPKSAYPFALNFVYLDIALHESLGILRYYFYNWMGWNPPSAI